MRGAIGSERSERSKKEREGASHLVKLSLPDIYFTDLWVANWSHPPMVIISRDKGRVNSVHGFSSSYDVM